MTTQTSNGSPSTSHVVTTATDVPITVAEFGAKTDGSAVLYLHGGAGPSTMVGLATALSEQAYGVVPTHPGFDGTPRPEDFDTMADLAEAYLDVLEDLDLTGVTVIGSSIGGWVAAEMALRDTRNRIDALVLINAVGIRAQGTDQVIDTRGLASPDISKLSFANAAFRPDFASFTDERKAVLAANQKTLATYAGEAFTHDPKLRARLHRVTVPTLVVWGEQDGIAPVGYGRDYAAAFPNGQFAPIADAGHFPQIEQLAVTLGVVKNFIDTAVKPSSPTR